MASSDYLERKINDAIYNNVSFSVATPFVALHTADPTDAGTGAEVSAGAYARQDISAQFDPAAGTSGSISNTGVITFPTATADWGLVTHASTWDAVTGGNMLHHGALTTNQDVSNGNKFEFPIGGLTITQQ